MARNLASGLRNKANVVSYDGNMIHASVKQLVVFQLAFEIPQLATAATKALGVLHVLFAHPLLVVAMI